MNSDAAVKLRGPNLSVDVPPSHIYFAFASGRFQYDCATCNAKCCRGHGYLINAESELPVQLSNRRAIALFMERAPGSHHGEQYVTKNCPPACFFLTDSGLCGVHLEHGSDAKPETCRLFPFNSFRWLDGYLIVAPHPGLCPLAIVPAGQRNIRSEYDQLLQDMRVRPIRQAITRCAGRHRSVAAVIASERQIIDISEAHCGNADYYLFTEAVIRADARDGWLGLARDSVVDVRAFAREVCDLLGVEQASQVNDSASRAMIAMTPYLRSRLLFDDNDADGASRMSVRIERIPYCLLALYVLVRTASSLSANQDVQYQTVVRLFDDMLPLITMLASLSEIVEWRPKAPVPLPRWTQPGLQRKYLRVAKALQPAAQRKNQMTLGNVLREYAKPSSLEEVVFLKELARQLSGRLSARSYATPWNGRVTVRTQVQSIVHQWGLTHLDENLLAAAYSRLGGIRKRSRPNELRAELKPISAMGAVDQRDSEPT